MAEYKIGLIAQSLSFYYESTEIVHASSLNEADLKAVDQFSKRTMISKHLVKVARNTISE